jgi:hypothetical protein
MGAEVGLVAAGGKQWSGWGERLRIAGALICLGLTSGVASRAQEPIEPPTGTQRDGGAREYTAARNAALPDSPEPKAEVEPSSSSLITPLRKQEADGIYVPISMRQRAQWVVSSSFSPQGLFAGVITSGVGTARNKPPEDGPGWSGFAQRYGTRLSGIIPSNAIEAGLGAVWGEDPRYFAAHDKPFGARVKNVMVQTFVARQRNGRYRPAYARYAAISGNNFLSNAWRPDSEANTSSALIRTGEGIAGRMASNAFEEFWPDVTHYLFHRHEPRQ